MNTEAARAAGREAHPRQCCGGSWNGLLLKTKICRTKVIKKNCAKKRMWQNDFRVVLAKQSGNRSATGGGSGNRSATRTMRSPHARLKGPCSLGRAAIGSRSGVLYALPAQIPRRQSSPLFGRKSPREKHPSWQQQEEHGQCRHDAGCRPPGLRWQLAALACCWLSEASL